MDRQDCLAICWWQDLTTNRIDESLYLVQQSISAIVDQRRRIAPGEEKMRIVMVIGIGRAARADQGERIVALPRGQPASEAIVVLGYGNRGTRANAVNRYRVRAGLRALGYPDGWPEWVLHQMVRLEQGGREVKFSKRAGSYTTLRELFELVGVDVARYFFLMRKPEAHQVFDLDEALDQSEKNPLYKMQYAHARMCSIFAKAGGDESAAALAGVRGHADLELLTHPSELALVRALVKFPEVVERAAAARAPHLLCDYLEQTAGTINSWYHAGNPTRNPELAVLAEDPEIRQARLVLARAVQIVLRNGLTVLGISAPTRMDRAILDEET